MAKKKRRGPRRQRFEDCVDYTIRTDPQTRGVMRSRGKKTGLGVRIFIWNLLALNESRGLPRKKKLTNAMIEHNVRAEFADREELINGINSGQQSVNWWRHLFNTGRLLKAKGKPRVVSLRYNESGRVVDTKTGLHELSNEDIAALCEKYEIDDQRYV